jgi:TPR repeat protein
MAGIGAEEAISTELLFRRGDAAEEAGDYAAARECFEAGARLGDPASVVRLGMLFDLGLGVLQDKAEAMRCYRRAWRRRDTCAANNIAVLYRERADCVRMFRWFQRAADAGDGGAFLELAKCRLAGIGAPKSTEAALRHLATAMSSDSISESDREAAADLLEHLRLRRV